MCVAVIVESPKQIRPSDIKAMADANPHGGGVAWIDGDQIQYRKGMEWSEIAWLQDHLPRPFLMHFRIATRGNPIPELTHPFPVGMSAFSDDLTGFADAVIIHNGTWSGYDPFVPNGIDRKLVSDTQVAAYVAERDESILDRVGWSNAIMRSVGGGRADLTLRGQWTEHEGNLYSNLHWQTDWFRDWDRPRVRSTLPAMRMPLDRESAKREKMDRKRAKRARRAARLASCGDGPQLDLVETMRMIDAGEYLDPDWEMIDAAIRSEGIKL